MVAATAFLSEAGAAAAWGVDMTLEGPISDSLASVEETLVGDPEDPDSSGVLEAGVGGLDLVAGLAALAFSGLTYIVMIIEIPLALPVLFLNLGVPSFIVWFVFAPLYVVVMLDIAALLMGDVRL